MIAKELILFAYSAFNRRQIDAALELMTEHVSWPKASEGGRAEGKQQIREYWTRQWAEFDPQVEALEVVECENGQIEVKVRQVVRDLEGNVLSDKLVWHIFAIVHGRIDRMDIQAGEENVEGPSAAFSRHHRK